MSEQNTTPTSRTNWERLNQMSDEDIDYSDIPPLDADFFVQASLSLPNVIQLEPEILAWFRYKQGDYVAAINRILRQYIEKQDRAA